MELLKEEVLNRWLEIEYYSIANKAKLISKTVQADDKLIFETIRCLDYVTTMENPPSVNYVIAIVALMWEHIDKNIYDLKNFIIKVLSRVGYPTSGIIIDVDYNKQDGKFFRPDSIFDILSLTLEQNDNEIVIGGHKFLLTDFQKEIWAQMDAKKIIGISAPTSAGKSFVLLLKTISRIIKEKLDIVYIVPTLSLLNQVTEDYNRMIKLLKINNCKILNSYIIEPDCEKNTIYILTQEKALSAFSNEKTAFNKKLILIADEIQNIERIEKDSDLRSKILFDTLIEFRHKKNIEQIIISGPRIDDINNLGKNIFGKSTSELKTAVSPVLNLTYSIKLEGNKKYYFKQYCPLLTSSFEREIENEEMISGYGKKQYTPEYMHYLSSFVKNVGSKEQNIIFAPTSNKAKDIAYALAKDSNESSTELDSLIKYYKQTINSNYAMCETLKHNIGYHHGKLPMHVRRTLEKAISEKKVSIIVCTTTLMQGVNMPAQNVIIRNPHLYIRKRTDSEELSSYEMANLRGRAGRLLKDFIGRTYVLDESGFENLDEYEQQLNLFDDVSMQLSVGYGEKYEKYQKDIDNAIKNMRTVDLEMKQYGYLVSYIRQTVMRYGKLSKSRMNEVGISLSNEQVAAIMSKMDSLSVPQDICYKNRYWDPLILNEIYESFKIKNLPNISTDRGARTRLDEILKFLRDTKETSTMYNKYIPEEYRKGLGRSLLCKACMDWALEKPLSQILVGDRYEGEQATENIDNTIELLQNIVSFNVPLLLKPVFDLFNPNSAFLTCMQTGAYNPYTRRMIEIGVPRETAIYLNRKLFNKINFDKKDGKVYDLIKAVINENFGILPYWIQVQLEFIKR